MQTCIIFRIKINYYLKIVNYPETTQTKASNANEGQTGNTSSKWCLLYTLSHHHHLCNYYKQCLKTYMCYFKNFAFF